MNCIVCGSMTSSGVAPWHTTCRYCDYESADLTPRINDQASHAQLNEHDREAALRALRIENFQAIIDLVGDKLREFLAAKLNAAVEYAVTRPDVQKLFADRNIETRASKPEEMAKLIRDEMAQWGEVVKRSNIRMD